MLHLTPLAHFRRSRGRPSGGAPTCSENSWDEQRKQSEAVGDAVPNRLWRYAKERSDRHRQLDARLDNKDMCFKSATHQVTAGEDHCCLRQEGTVLLNEHEIW
ncbi:hypothetical protein LC612_40295 [Nostoc sp. CHAB 5834]|nr:hypothetical protein [Nostoc sp. CHAB 5834]